MLKTLKNTESLTRPGKSGVGVGGDSKAGHDGNELNRSKVDNSEVDGNEVRNNEVGKKVQKLSKSQNLFKSKKTIGSDFFTLKARLAFTKLRQAFVKVPILYYFDLEYHIRIETDISGYVIDKDLSQLTSNDLGRWHLLVFSL